MLTHKYVIAVLTLTLILGMTSCGQGQPDQPAVNQIVGTSTPEPAANPMSATAPTVAIVESAAVAPTPLPPEMRSYDIADDLVACFERDEFMWNAYKSALQESAREHNIPAFTEMVMDDDLQPADTWLLLVRAMYDAEEARVMDEWVKRCEQGETTVTNVTASTAPAPTSPPTATAIIWSIENQAAFGSRSITSADKTQRWTCIGADRPRINITHPAAHTVAAAVAGRTTEDKDTIINGESYKFAWAAWSSNPSWTPEEHALNVRHDQALQLKQSLVSSGATSFSVSIEETRQS